jgi:hypothetical protein
MTKVLWAACAVLALSAVQASASPAVGARACGAAADAEAYPTFCGIPKTPTDIRSAEAFKGAVVATRRAGARLTRDASEGFGLPVAAAEAFAAEGRAEAEPPPAATESTADDTEAFAAAARRRAAPPSRPRR